MKYLKVIIAYPFEKEKKNFQKKADKKEANGGNRTPDLLITNQLLYRLSYTSIVIIITALLEKSNGYLAVFTENPKI